jgi:hypothetical protein
MRTLRFLLVAALTCIPAAVYAAETNFFGPIVPPCTEGGTAGLCQACNLVQLGQNILRFFVSLSVVAATVMFAYAGFLYVSASSNRSNLDSARTIFVNVFIGLILILTAYLIIDLTLKVLTGQPLSAISKIQCVKQERSNLKAEYTPVEDAPGQGAPEEEPGEEGGGATYDAPTGSCVQISQENAKKFGSTPNCNPGQRVNNYGNGAAALDRLKRNHGGDIDSCAQQVGVDRKVIYTIAVLECGGKSTCTDPAPRAQCQKGNGATGIGCAGVTRYCSAFPSDPNCRGWSSLSDSQKAQRISSTPKLAFCATGYSMKQSRKPGEAWADTAGRYNGSGGYAPSRDCPGYTQMQCPIARGGSQFPYCHITCSYRDSFGNVYDSAGKI